MYQTLCVSLSPLNSCTPHQLASILPAGLSSEEIRPHRRPGVVELHSVIQLVMGWDNWHLYCFQIFGRRYGINYTGGGQFLRIARSLA